MLKLFFLILTFFTSTLAIAQKINKVENKYEVINSIFKNFIKYEESVDSEKNKTLMTSICKKLENKVTNKELYLLIDIWMYYTPTDYSTRKTIEPIFFKHKKNTIYNINKRIKNKEKWESKDMAPFSELFLLREKLFTP
jgi:hypothetical protein